MNIENEYNDEPVVYCAKCLSLKIMRTTSQFGDYCADCASMDIQTANIKEWEDLYKGRYGKEFLTIEKKH